jgi:bifunctional UDP-N-acetylglucosamine pyrophosphorylase/glucosamine-1-phosphate N-acetyltransferase
MELSIVVLAAGEGKRMKSQLPKVVQPIGGKPMLAHVLVTAKSLDPSQIIVVHGYGKDIVRDAVNDPSLKWVEQAERLGTGDAVQRALPLVPKSHRVLILYGDVPLIAGETLKRLLSATPKNSVGLLTVSASDPTGLGRIIRDSRGKIERIVEEKDADDIQRQIHEVNTGIFVVQSEKLHEWLPKLKNNNSQKEYYLTDIVHLAVKEGGEIASAVPSVAEEVLGVNDKSQQATAERHYQKHLAEQLLREGVGICDPSRFDLRGTLHAKTDVTIDINVVFEGRNEIGAGSNVGPNCVLIDCIIGDNTQILANSHLENVTIGDNCTIGPFARLRPGCDLSDNVKVGNFVEVKKSSIGAGSKVNHLSYIGDAQIGMKVNIGAGTITCNYDGANKHCTIIDDAVFVGSGSQLVAPVHIAAGATIAAGSTVRLDVPEGLLTVTHDLKQRSISNWVRPVKKSELPSIPLEASQE